MAWVGDHLFSHAQALVAGFTINCPESAETVMTDLREIWPDLLFRAAAGVRKPADAVMIRMEDAGKVKQEALPLLHGRRQALRRGPFSTASRWAPARLRYWLGNV